MDITTRLRRWTHAADAAPASDLMDEAAAEIARLRLTDEEREAIDEAANFYADVDDSRCQSLAVTLRGLLDRTQDHEKCN
jgi:hypothetical protein